MLQKNVFLTLTLFCLICTAVRSALAAEDYTVTGKIIDQRTKKPLADANVFIANSMIGDASDRDGVFKLEHVPSGTFELVASVIGYEVEKIEIVVPQPADQQILLSLEPRILDAPEVVVKASDLAKRDSRFDRFKRLLFSNTKFASKMHVLNPDALLLEGEVDGEFRVFAEGPIHIENRALGYRIDFFLKDFRASKENLRYKGFVRFQELEAKSTKEAKSWRKNRLNAWRGSLRHFLATIHEGMNGDMGKALKREGFDVYAFQHSWERESRRTNNKTNINLYLKPGERDDEILLSFTGYLGVIYEKEYESQGYISFHKITQRQARFQESWIEIPGNVVKIGPYGRYHSSSPINKHGYWAWERVADMLPFEYQPK